MYSYSPEYFTPKKIGTNGHVEYSWSNDLREKLFQFNYQLIRTDAIYMKNLRQKAIEILSALIFYYQTLVEKETVIYYLTIFYKIIGHTRDIVDGKGEYTLTYMLICVWYSFYPELSLYAVKCLVYLGNNHPYGSWKDMKYLCHYARFNEGFGIEHPLIQYTIGLMNNQLEKDCNNFINNTKTNPISISLVAKWIPREKSKKFGWLYQELACQYFPYYKLAINTTSSHKALLKCLTEYRKLISTLNDSLGTLEIKQCNQQWSNINFSNVTSISLTKQCNSFLNMNNNNNNNNNTKTDSQEKINDRNICEKQFKEFLEREASEKNTISSNQVGIVELVKQAIQTIEMLKKEKNIDLQEKIKAKQNLLNLQWENQSNITDSSCKMLPIVDLSNYKKDDNSYYSAVGLGIKIAEKTIIGKRILVLGGFPKWIHFEDEDHFVDMVQKVYEIESGINTDIYALLDKLIEVIIETKLSAEEITSITLVILSSWELNICDTENNTLYENIKTKFKKLEFKPRILLWNLKSTDGFPSVSLYKNVSMGSGYNPKLLNLFCSDGLKTKNPYMPWTFFIKSLENKRYDVLEQKIRSFLT